MEIKDAYYYLNLEGKETYPPKWLKDYKKGDKINFKDILNTSRTVYYPGAGTDGESIKVLNKEHYAHTFIYVDYMLSYEERLSELTEPHALRGYHLYEARRLNESELSPNGWRPHIHLTVEQRNRMNSFNNLREGFAILAVYERDSDFDYSHGGDRIAIIYIGGDAFATYDALFVNNNQAPSLLVLKDHGFGCNYDVFGPGGILEKLMKENNCFPKLVLTKYETKIYNNYFKAADALDKDNWMRDAKYLFVKK